MVFLSCNDKGKKNLDLKTGLKRLNKQICLIFTSKKLIVYFEYSAVNLFVG